MLQAVPEDIPLNIVYEDDHLIVVNKVKAMQPKHVHSQQRLPCQLAYWLIDPSRMYNFQNLSSVLLTTPLGPGFFLHTALPWQGHSAHRCCWSSAPCIACAGVNS